VTDGRVGRAAGPRADDADAEAARRVAWVLGELEHLDLNVVVLPPADDALIDAVERARDAALMAGRHDLLESATRSAREIAMRAFSRSGFSGTWAATEMGASVVRADDRVAAAEAFEAAAAAAVVEDLVDAGIVEVLREPTDALRRTTGMPAPGALSTFASGGSPTPAIGTTDTVQVGLGIAVVVAGIIVAFAAGALPIGLIVIASGIALLGSIGRRRSGPE
jgi:hypothetical protein